MRPTQIDHGIGSLELIDPWVRSEFLKKKMKNVLQSKTTSTSFKKKNQHLKFIKSKLKTKRKSTPMSFARRQGIDTKISSLTNSILKFESFQSHKKPKYILVLLETLHQNDAKDNGYKSYSKDELEIDDR